MHFIVVVVYLIYTKQTSAMDSRNMFSELRYFQKWEIVTPAVKVDDPRLVAGRQYDPYPDPNTTTGTSEGTPVKPWKGEPISNYIKRFKKFDLLDYMEKFWTGLNQPSWVLWAHEFSKHATCYSTFDTECYGPAYVKHEEVPDFFSTTVAYFQQVPTWKWLATGGIVPSNKTGYSISDIGTLLRGNSANYLTSAALGLDIMKLRPARALVIMDIPC
ncbi:hypothetical protein RRF57_008767 [Xylaria bambusicola]|uniref:ribonuclease T2 n=1 Tax=Xylaria bambusicola TaxID=326684 RepID=A0AAN7ZBL9_9PEZI